MENNLKILIHSKRKFDILQLMERKIKLDLSDLKSSLVFINNKKNI